MRKPIYILTTTILVSTFLSCGSDEPKKEVKKEKETTEPKNDSIADSTTVEKEEFMAKKTVEDYGTLKTFEEALAYFGDTNMVADTSWYAEGTVMMLSHQCTDPNNDQIVTLVWEKGGKEKLAHVEVRNQLWDKNYSKVLGTQKVESNCGLYTGMTLKELEKFCGEPVKFSGFGWDYAGGVRHNLPKLEACKVNITLDMDQSDFDRTKHLLGDIELSSDQKEVQDMPIFVQKITFYR